MANVVVLTVTVADDPRDVSDTMISARVYHERTTPRGSARDWYCLVLRGDRHRPHVARLVPGTTVTVTGHQEQRTYRHARHGELVTVQDIVVWSLDY